MVAKNNKKKAEYAFNVFYPFYVFGLIVMSWANLYLLLEEYTFHWLLLLIWLIFVLVICLDSLYYIFTKDEIYFVKIWGHKKRIPWFYITNIIKHDFWSPSVDRWTYEIFYKEIRKGKEVRFTLHLPATPKINKCIYKYYSETIVGTKKRKRK